MIMIVQLPKDVNVSELAEDFRKAGEEQGLQIQVMQEDIFEAMHTI